MKIKTTFIVFAILVLSFIGLRSGTATTSQLPHSDKQIANAKSGSFNFLSCFGGSDADDCDDVAVDAAGHIYLACHSLSNDFPVPNHGITLKIPIVWMLISPKSTQ
jgi:hypothetical protein